MEIRFVDRNRQLTEAIQENTTRNLLFALSRFAREIEYITVIAEDTNGPRGGVDKRCRLQAKLRRLGIIEVSQDSTRLGAGLSRAARRLGHSVARQLKRKSGFPRESIRPAVQ